MIAQLVEKYWTWTIPGTQVQEVCRSIISGQIAMVVIFHLH